MTACAEGADTQPLYPAGLASDEAEAFLRAKTGADEADFEVIVAVAESFPETGAIAYHGVLEDRRSGEPMKLFFDADGHESSAPAMAAREQAAIRARRGVLGARVMQRVHEADAGEAIDVVVHYETPAVEKPPVLWDREASRLDVERALDEVRVLRREAATEARRAAERELVERGAEIVAESSEHASPSAVFARMPVEQLQELGRGDYAGRIAAVSLPLDEEDVEPQDFFYASDDHEAKETFVDAGIDGEGIKVGIIEMAGGCGLWYGTQGSQVQPTPFASWSGYTQEGPSAVKGCDALPDGSPCTSSCNNDGNGTCRLGRCVAQHATAVASHIGAAYTGCTSNCNGGGSDRNAAAAHIYFAQSSPTMSQRLAWFANNGVRVFNHSETAAGTNAVNWAIRNYWMTGTHSAGNGPGTIVNCYANAICVGAARPTNTTTVIDRWKTDPRDTTDAYRLVEGWQYGNGIQGQARADVEKPDVVAIDNAPGVDARSGDWVNFGGTSFAAPSVAGMVALLQDRAPFTAVWPELTRAIIMASAVSHNVEGSQLSTHGGADERDGAGMPVMSNVEKIVANGWVQPGRFTPSSFSNRWAEGPSITLAPGEGVRVVLGWMHCVQSNNDNDNGEVLAADFDLYLQNAWGGNLAYSVSSNNSLEMLEYTNNTGSSQTVRVRTHQYGTWNACGGTQSEYYGLAWAKHAGYLVL